MNNDSSKTNVLDLIADHMNNSTPNHMRMGESETEPASSSELHAEDEQYPSQEAKRPAIARRKQTLSIKQSPSSSSYPSQNAKAVIDVDTIPRSRSSSPVPPLTPAATAKRAVPASANSTSTGNAATMDPRKQRRRRRYHREQQQKQKQEQQQGKAGEDSKPAARVQRSNTLPTRTYPIASPSNSKARSEVKKITRSATGPMNHMRVGASVDVEMDGSDFDLMKLVAQRASNHSRTVDLSSSSSSSSGSSSDDSESSTGISHYYDEEVGAYADYAAQEEKKAGDNDDAAAGAPARASMNAVQYIMNDLSGTSIGLKDLKAGSTNAIDVTLGATPAMASSVAGAYSAAPGQGYVRTEGFQAGVLGTTTIGDESMRDVSLQYSYGGASHEQARMRDESNKSHETVTDSSSKSNQHPVISAVRVDEDDLELHIREQITSNAAQAEVVDLEKETEHHVKKEMEKVQRKYIVLAVFAFIVIGVVVAVVSVLFARNNNNGGSSTQGGTGGSLTHHPAVLSTLKSVSKKGHLNCGLSKRDEDAKFLPEYATMWNGFNGDWCRAIAAAALDGDVSVTVHDVTESERWEALKNGTLDVLVVGTPSSTQSLHFDLDREVPAIFSTPFLFDGVGVGGLPEYIKHCATTKGFENYLGCRSVKVCACQGSGALEVFERILHPSQIVEVSAIEELYSRFANGCCNMIATDWSNERAEVTVRKESGYEGPYALGEALYSKQPYALATRKIQNEYPTNVTDDAAREDDPQVWSEFVDWVLQALIAAEQSGITQATSHMITETEVFGDKYRKAFKHAVAAVGNYGEVYERNMGHVVPRDGMNLIANGTTGLHYHRSIGDVTDFGTLNEHGTLAAIKERGKLVCGVPILQNKNFTLEAGEEATRPPSRFLEETSVNDEHDLGAAGIDMEFCRALASSIFQGLSITNADLESCLANNDTETEASDARIEFRFLESNADGYTQLNNGEIDVVSGYRMTLQADVKEPTTGQGYTFSQPFLYGPVDKEEHVTANNRCMVTRQHDQQWSDFVQIVVMSLFYAEEHHIDQPHANSMPYVNLFGPTYKRMMKDSVFAVGNYGEVYERLVEPHLHREGGPNKLNAEADPQLCSFPGPII